MAPDGLADGGSLGCLDGVFGVASSGAVNEVSGGDTFFLLLVEVFLDSW